jgi:hypothetical protein
MELARLITGVVGLRRGRPVPGSQIDGTIFSVFPVPDGLKTVPSKA